MRAFTKTILAAVAVLVILPLGACETVEGWTDGETPKAKETQKTAELATPPMSSGMDNAPGVRAVPNFPVPADRDLKVMTSKLSGGSVEIYDLDGATDMGAPVAPVTPDYQGIPMASDSRVTVYPIDGYAAYPGEMRPMPVAPVSSYASGQPNSILPPGQTFGSGMTPPPDSFGGDQPMAIEGGKLSSRSGPSVSNIYFPYGSAALDGSDSRVLNDVAETAKFAPVDRVSVEGHASMPTQVNDPVKAKILNLKESANRATKVSEQLIQNGVPAEKIKTVAWGDTKPAGGPEAAQRRVDIYTAGP